MKSYWKLVAIASALVGLLSALLVATVWESVLPALAVLASGVLGARLAPLVDKLARQAPKRVVLLLIAAGGAIALGAALHLTAVWSLGIAAMLTLPLARMASECREDDRIMAAVLR